MAYITNADIELRVGPAAYVQLTDDEGTGTANEARVDEARLGAEGEVDSRLGRRFVVPVDVDAHLELAGLLKTIALDLAEYRLNARRPPVEDDVKAKRAAAIRWLEDVAEGRAVLPAAEELEGAAAGGMVAAAAGPERVLTREEMTDF